MNQYDYYGDKADLEENYDLMRDWVEWIRRQDDLHGGKRLCTAPA